MERKKYDRPLFFIKIKISVKHTIFLIKTALCFAKVHGFLIITNYGSSEKFKTYSMFSVKGSLNWYLTGSPFTTAGENFPERE